MDFLQSAIDASGLDPQIVKEGVFEWIVGFDDLAQFLSPRFTGVRDPFKKPGDAPKLYMQNVLVIGCGTSTLSADIAAHTPQLPAPVGSATQTDIEVDAKTCGQEMSLDDLFRAKAVLSIDNDPNIISYMRSQGGGDEKMQWMEYDIVDNVGSLQEESHSGSYDLVVDKGTLDAVLVGGAVYTMLLDINRLLRCGGAYVVCSIFGMQVLTALLGIEELGWQVRIHTIDYTELKEDTRGTVAICKKVTDKGISAEVLQRAEKLVMDLHFQEITPLLTAEYESTVRERFAKVIKVYQNTATAGIESGVESGSESGLGAHRESLQKLPPTECYKVLITKQEEQLGYDYELFCEDLVRFQKDIKDTEDAEEAGAGAAGGDFCMSVEQCLDFVRTMQ